MLLVTFQRHHILSVMWTLLQTGTNGQRVAVSPLAWGLAVQLLTTPASD